MGRSLSTWSPPWLWLSPALPSTVFNGSFLVPRSHTAEVFFGRATILRQPQQAKPFSEKSVSSGHAHTQQSRGHPLSRRHPGHSTTSKRAQPPAPESRTSSFTTSSRQKGSRAGPQIQVEDTTPPDPPHTSPEKTRAHFQRCTKERTLTQCLILPMSGDQSFRFVKY